MRAQASVSRAGTRTSSGWRLWCHIPRPVQGRQELVLTCPSGTGMMEPPIGVVPFCTQSWSSLFRTEDGSGAGGLCPCPAVVPRFSHPTQGALRSSSLGQLLFFPSWIIDPSSARSDTWLVLHYTGNCTVESCLKINELKAS